MSSTYSIACPELIPAATLTLPLIDAAEYMLYRVRMVGAGFSRKLASAPTGIIVPARLRTFSNWVSSI